MLDNITDILISISKIPALKEHRDVIEAKLNSLQSDYDKLEKQLFSTLKENEQLKTKLAKYEQLYSSEFTDFQSFKLKKDENGRFLKTPFCPKCNDVMSVWAGMYVCENPKHDTYTIPEGKTNTAIEEIVLKQR